MNTSSSRRRAYSQVIAALILSTVVLAIGGAIWAFSQGAMTMTAEDYVESVINMTDTISERFIVEQVTYNGTHLFVWIFNYGDVDIVVDLYVHVDGGGSGNSTNCEVPSGAIGNTEIKITIESNIEVAIKAESKRGNNAYYRFIFS